MPRTTNDNLDKVFTMHVNGLGLHAAWLECSKLEGGATSWGNCQRRWNEKSKQQQHHAGM